MPNKRDRRCLVCGAWCYGRLCNECHHTKNNRYKGRYKLKKERKIPEKPVITMCEYLLDTLVN